jgi:hypothetical protein
VCEEKIGVSSVTQRIFVISHVLDVFESCCDEQEAANRIADMIEEEGLYEDDIYVVRGEEINLKITKHKVSTVSFNGKKVL